MPKQRSAKSTEVGDTTSILRAIAVLLIERERRAGLSGDQMSAMLARSGLSSAEVAALLGTTPATVRAGVQRARKKVTKRKRATPSRRRDA